MIDRSGYCFYRPVIKSMVGAGVVVFQSISGLAGTAGEGGPRRVFDAGSLS